MKRMASDRGAAAVEFALVLPLLFLLVGGIVDFGLALNARITLTHAARESVRMWALNSSADMTQAKADLQKRAEETAGGLDVTAAPVDTSSPCTFGEPTEVVVTATFHYIFLSAVLPDPASLSATGVMRCGG